jgi:hypothetical protein
MMLTTVFNRRVDPNDAESLAAYFGHKWSLPERNEIFTFYMTERLRPLFEESLNSKLEKINCMKASDS